VVTAEIAIVPLGVTLQDWTALPPFVVVAVTENELAARDCW
jgi:hypothetical protein